MHSHSLFKSHYRHLLRAPLALIELSTLNNLSKKVAQYYRSLRLVHRLRSTTIMANFL
jgi:hypothetical protein